MFLPYCMHIVMSIAVLNHQPHNSVLETTIVMPKSSCRNLRLYNIIIKFIKLCSSYYILFHNILQYCILYLFGKRSQNCIITIKNCILCYKSSCKSICLTRKWISTIFLFYLVATPYVMEGKRRRLPVLLRAPCSDLTGLLAYKVI